MGGYSNPFDRPLDSEIAEHQQAHAATTAASPNGNPFDEPLASEKAEAALTQGGSTPEEQAFLKAHPDHVYLKADPKFPNRPEGVYPTGPGNEWRSDPSYDQKPVDPELLKHSAQYGVGAAAAVGIPTVAAGALATSAVTPAQAAANYLGVPAAKTAEAVIAHLNSLDKVVKAAKALGYGLTLEGAHALYKMFSEDKK